MTFKGEYGESAQGNFKVVDTIPTTHAFCVTPKHIAYAADHHHGILDEYVIERSGAPCGVKGCNLAFNDHKFALLISCRREISDPKTQQAVPELHEYLCNIKDECEKNGYVGFAFVKSEDFNDG
jgi:hypothetical protein